MTLDRAAAVWSGCSSVKLRERCTVAALGRWFELFVRYAEKDYEQRDWWFERGAGAFGDEGFGGSEARDREGESGLADWRRRGG
jgi:hypothetical protein